MGGYNLGVGERRGLWESIKRALVGPSPAPAQPVPPDPGERPRRESAPWEPPVPSTRNLPEIAVTETPPFLAEAEAVADSVPASPAPNPGPAPGITPGPAEAPTSAAKEGEASLPQGPRLARGLASFSKRNPEREKKFAHLLHDAPSDGKERTRPSGRRS